MKLNIEKTASFINCGFGDVLSKMNTKFISMEKLTQLAEMKLEAIIRELCSIGYDTFVTGASIGFEMSAAKSILKIKEIYPDIKLILVVAYRGEELVGYSVEEKQTYKLIYDNALSVVYPTPEFKGYEASENIVTKDAYLLSHCSKIVVADISKVEKHLPETVVIGEMGHLLVYTIDYKPTIEEPVVKDSM